MQTNILLSGKNKRLLMLGGAGLLIVLILLVATIRSCSKSEPTAEELRMQHLDWIVRLLEAYKDGYGSYPQPTVRVENQDGVKHVWGYRPDTPSLASCTVKTDQEGAIVPEESVCGGGVYDIDGNLVGWKGTITPESGLNSIEIAERGSGRVESPLSEIVQAIPIDPEFADQSYAHIGLGEYIYAVRNPDSPGADGRDEYQIAITTKDKMTGEKRTIIRGNYFVRSDEKNIMPFSLIGPGILFDDFGNPVEEQDVPFHSLLDGQKYGYPNPVLGEGSDVMQLLELERSAKHLIREIEKRMLFINNLPISDAESISSIDLSRERIHNLVDDFRNGTANTDPSEYELEINSISNELAQTMDSFVADYASKVEHVLAQEVDHRDEVFKLLNDVFEILISSEDSVLVARDEILNYLDGEGIEEQTRHRAGRKLKGILEGLPDLDAVFDNKGYIPMRIFLNNKEDQSEEREILLTTIYSDLYLHISDFRHILNTILEDLLAGGAELNDVDSSLANLMGSLSREHSRIRSMFDEVTDTENAVKVLSDFRAQKDENPIEAINNSANKLRMRGDLSPIVFDSSVLKDVSSYRAPGIPDVGIVEDELMAEYKGIPYPIP